MVAEQRPHHHPQLDAQLAGGRRDLGPVQQAALLLELVLEAADERRHRRVGDDGQPGPDGPQDLAGHALGERGRRHSHHLEQADLLLVEEPLGGVGDGQPEQAVGVDHLVERRPRAPRELDGRQLAAAELEVGDQAGEVAVAVRLDHLLDGRPRLVHVLQHGQAVVGPRGLRVVQPGVDELRLVHARHPRTRP